MQDEQELLNALNREELKKEARARIQTLKHVYADHCVFSFRQADKLASTRHWESQGVCMTLSLDWLRRHLHNRGRPEAKEKRNYGDKKYETRRGRQSLMEKTVAAQSVYEGARARGFSSGAAGALASFNEGIPANNAPRKTRTRLRLLPKFACLSTSDVATSSIRLDDGLQAHRAKQWFYDNVSEYYDACLPALDSNIPALGIILSLLGGGEGHAVAFLLSPEEIRFFDPNLGEYSFRRTDERFLCFGLAATLWADWYYPVEGYRSARFEPIFFENQSGGFRLVHDEESSEW